MNEIKLIEDSIKDILPGEITAKRKFPILAAICLPLGIATIIAAYRIPSLRSDGDVSSALIFIGAALFLIAVIQSVIVFSGRKKRFVYAATGEPLKCGKKYFDIEQKEGVCDLLNSGKLSHLGSMKESETSGLQLVAYYVPSGDIVVAQAQSYIPHEYVPATETLVFRKGEYQ